MYWKANPYILCITVILFNFLKSYHFQIDDSSSSKKKKKTLHMNASQSKPSTAPMQTIIPQLYGLYLRKAIDNPM